MNVNCMGILGLENSNLIKKESLFNHSWAGSWENVLYSFEPRSLYVLSFVTRSAHLRKTIEVQQRTAVYVLQEPCTQTHIWAELRLCNILSNLRKLQLETQGSRA